MPHDRKRLGRQEGPYLKLQPRMIPNINYKLDHHFVPVIEFKEVIGELNDLNDINKKIISNLFKLNLNALGVLNSYET
jgi:hypothetical protein